MPLTILLALLPLLTTSFFTPLTPLTPHTPVTKVLPSLPSQYHHTTTSVNKPYSKLYSILESPTTSIHTSLHTSIHTSIHTTSITLCETESWVAPAALSGDIFLNLLSLLMLSRIVISWYPKTDLTSFPFNIIVLPTEWILRPTRGVVPPAFGVDVSPIVWLAVSTFLHEIFLGQQVRGGGRQGLIPDRA